MDEKWLHNVLNLLPSRLKESNERMLRFLSSEMRDDYTMSVKKAIVDFVLKDPRENSMIDGDEDNGNTQSFVMCVVNAGGFSLKTTRTLNHSFSNLGSGVPRRRGKTHIRALVISLERICLLRTRLSWEL